jgi:hypothetical protein
VAILTFSVLIAFSPRGRPFKECRPDIAGERMAIFGMPWNAPQTQRAALFLALFQEKITLSTL